MENSKEVKIEKVLEKRMETKVTQAVTKGINIFFTVVISFAITVVALKYVWAWGISDLFPGAVEQGLINETLTWLTTVKLAVFVSVVNGTYHTLSEAFEEK